MNAKVEHGEQSFQRGKPDAGKPAGKRVEPQQHRRAHRVRRERVARAAGVADDQVSLQFFGVRVRNSAFGELAKAGRDPVDHRAVLALCFHNRAGAVDCRFCRIRNTRGFKRARHARNLLQRQPGAVECYHLSASPICKIR
ncbi:hypothetical protein SDC9_204307 [bioreactor metagenome]|uniref:Uncharacterized protein n=1 Tax=bioreactor metagenome TaxID=1076179 RepID=A0A645IZM8_9ZZZZ